MKGALLVNLGTPDAPTVPAVRRYLREFLGDPRVLDLPAPLRWLLLWLVILPFRPRRSARAYARIWDPRTGSPLLHHSERLAAAVAAELGSEWRVALGMRYGSPAIGTAVAALAGCESIFVLPLFPQTATSTTDSAIAAVEEAAAARGAPPLRTVRGFALDAGWVEGVAARTRPVLADVDHLLISFHGVPERHLRRADPTGAHCLASPGCCDGTSPVHAVCYRAQCLHGARAIARALALPDARWSVAFQSRVGRGRWTEPATDARIRELAASGVRRLAVVCPSFVCDCLETLEEIGIGGAEAFREAGGEQFVLVPCPNDDPAWVRAVCDIVRRNA